MREQPLDLDAVLARAAEVIKGSFYDSPTWRAHESVLAQQDVPALVDEVRRLRADNATLRAMIEEALAHDLATPAYPPDPVMWRLARAYAALEAQDE